MIPDSVRMGGTVRSLSENGYLQLIERVTQVNLHDICSPLEYYFSQVCILAMSFLLNDQILYLDSLRKRAEADLPPRPWIFTIYFLSPCIQNFAYVSLVQPRYQIDSAMISPTELVNSDKTQLLKRLWCR